MVLYATCQEGAGRAGDRVVAVLRPGHGADGGSYGLWRYVCCQRRPSLALASCRSREGKGKRSVLVLWLILSLLKTCHVRRCSCEGLIIHLFVFSCCYLKASLTSLFYHKVFRYLSQPVSYCRLECLWICGSFSYFSLIFLLLCF